MKFMLKFFYIFLVTICVMLTNYQPSYAAGADIPILLYHRTADINNELCISPEKFEQQIQALFNAGYRTITLKQLKQLAVSGSAEGMPAKPVLITFDDGYKDTYTAAYPILRKYGFTGAVFVITDYFYQPGYITPSQVLEMRHFGMDFGSHTAGHRILTQQNEANLVEQLTKSKQELESLLEQPVEFIAYPCGYYNQNVLNNVKKAGYYGGFTVTPGTNYAPLANTYKLKRIPIFRHTKSVLAEIEKVR